MKKTPKTFENDDVFHPPFIDNWCALSRIKAILLCLCALCSHHVKDVPVPYLHTCNCQNEDKVEVQTWFPYINLEMGEVLHSIAECNRKLKPTIIAGMQLF